MLRSFTITATSSTGHDVESEETYQGRLVAMKLEFNTLHANARITLKGKQSEQEILTTSAEFTEARQILVTTYDKDGAEQTAAADARPPVLMQEQLVATIANTGFAAGEVATLTMWFE